MHWIECPDATTITRRLGFIEAEDETWVLSPKTSNILLDDAGNSLEQVVIDTKCEALYRLGTPDDLATLIICPLTDQIRSFDVVGYAHERSLTIGSAPDNTYVYDSSYVSAHHARIDFKADRFTLSDLGSKHGTFVNGRKLKPHTPTLLNHGDVVKIISFTLCSGSRFFSMNEPGLHITDDTAMVYYAGQPDTGVRLVRSEEAEDAVYFYPAPRFKRNIVSKSFSIDAPPSPEKPDETPLAMKIGPSMVMSFAAVFSGVVMFTSMLDSGGSILRAVPMLVMAVSMLLGAVLWPVLSRRFSNRKARIAEDRRRATYAAYLDKVRLSIHGEWVIKPAYSTSGSFVYGLAPARKTPGSLMGYINESGEWAIEPQFGYCEEFDVLGLAVVDTEDEVSGYINTSGEWVSARFCLR